MKIVKTIIYIDNRILTIASQNWEQTYATSLSKTAEDLISKLL